MGMGKLTSALSVFSLCLCVVLQVSSVPDGPESDDSELESKKLMMLNRLIARSLFAGFGDPLLESRDFSSGELRRLRNAAINKRQGGGMRLCVWKVCPPRPWLY